MSKKLHNTYHFNILSFHLGDETAFEHFFKLYYKKLCFFANRYVMDKAVAEDIVEESFVKFWEMRESIDSEQPVKSLLYTMVRNAAISYLRKQKVLAKRKKGYDALQEETEGYMLQQMIAAETMMQIYSAIGELPEGCRNVVTKLYVEGKGLQEIADELNISINTVKTQRARGLKFIRGRLTGLLVLLMFFG